MTQFRRPLDTCTAFLRKSRIADEVGSGGRMFSRYELGCTAFISSQIDPRFSYALYVPAGYEAASESAPAYDLMIVVHPSERTVMEYRDGFAGVAETLGCFVFAPLFPIGTVTLGDVDNYKYIDNRGLRYDLLLLGMIAEVERRYAVRFDRRVLYGFSGGGQFAHRFAYLHPETLDAVAIGAPGKVTLLDPDRDWWMGIRDVESRFGRPVDLSTLRNVPMQLVVGGDDIDEEEIFIPEDSPLWQPGANDIGRNRIERLTTLRNNLERNGITTRMSVVPGVAHCGTGQIIECVGSFFEDVLRRSRTHKSSSGTINKGE